MLDLKYLRDHLEAARGQLKARGFEFASVEEILTIDDERRGLQAGLDAARAELKKKSQEFGAQKKQGGETGALTGEISLIKERIAEAEHRFSQSELQIFERLKFIPNLPQASVPVGDSSAANPVVRVVGKPPEFTFKAREHAEIGEALGILDFERAARMTGARFTIYRGLGAGLERALINLMLDLHTREHGYEEMLPPFIVNSQALFGTGQLPKFETDLFRLQTEHGYYLIPTAEVPVTNFHQDEILEEEDLPVKYVAYTPCFRSEAGSYGKDTRGLIRQHQFNKVELVQFATPETSAAVHETLTAHAEKVLQKLNLPYRVVELCTGDLGFASSKTYDIEVWLPGQGAYREISSCSNFTDYQARRAKIRYRPKGGGKPQFLHTLNGSGLAVGRTVVALLENFQQMDGSVLIPEALAPYMNGARVIKKAK